MFSIIKKAAIGLAGGYIKEYLTTSNITSWIVDAVNALLSKAMQNIDADKMERVCKTASDISILCGNLSKALADKTITKAEAQAIVADIQRTIGNSGIDDAKIGSLIDKALSALKERL